MFFISDIHLGDKGNKDDFKQNEEAFIEFLKPIPNKGLIIVGDLFDLWETDLGSIISSYMNLLEIMRPKVYAYVLGNHDQKMQYHINLFYAELSPADHLIIGKTLVMHGHQFDIINSTYDSVGFYIAKGVGWLEEHIWPGIDKPMFRFENWLRRQGKFGDPEFYRNKSIAFADGIIIDNFRLNKVILGHTHKTESDIRIGGYHYYNCGTWTGKDQNFIEIPDKDL